MLANTCCLIVFQGSGATGDCCSKCWRDLQKKGEVEAAPKSMQPFPVKSEVTEAPMEVGPQPMEVDPIVELPAVEETKPEVPAPTPKKKSKKATYKSMMAGLIKSSPERDVEKDKDSLRKVTGGGSFSKIDKI